MSDELWMFAKPDTDLVRLGVKPQLASWDAAGHPSQVRLKAFLTDAYEICRQRLDLLPDPLALRLDIGHPATTPLLEQHDLDNYLYPLATHLSRLSGRQFVSVWGTKQHAESSYIGVTQAVPISKAAGFGQVIEFQTTASGGSRAFKEQIDQELAAAVALPDGPVMLHVCFGVGPGRVWSNLWKPTIDALGRLLGRTTPDRPWHPRDGRIVELGLSNHLEPSLGNDVAISITAALANGPATSA